MNIQQFDLEADLLRAILWQYEKAPRLKKLVEGFHEIHNDNNAGFWQQWYRDVFNVDTANEFGLRLWARILDVKLAVEFEPQEKMAFGFGANRRRFGKKSNFGARDGASVSLTVEQLRLAVKARYFMLTTQPTMDNINEFMRANLWRGESKAYALDTFDMEFWYVFTYAPDPGLQFLLDNTDFLPRPSGVKMNWRIISKKAFGFGRHRKRFGNNSNFGTIQ